MLASSLLLVDDPNLYAHWNNSLVWLITLDEFRDSEQTINSSNRVVQIENNSVNKPNIDGLELLRLLISQTV